MGRSVLAILLVAGVGAAAGARAQDQVEALETAGALLAPYTTQSELSAHLEREPFACAAVGEDRSICSWELGSRDSGWSALARAVSTDERINVVCELPTDGGARAPDACSVHPRRSNRYEWKPIQRSVQERMKNRFSRETSRETQEERQERASALLEAAQSPLELSRLVGQGPEQCGKVGAGLYRCVWYTTRRTWGHGTLAMVIDAPIRKKLRMHCNLPADGSPRAPGSCGVEIGAR